MTGTIARNRITAIAADLPGWPLLNSSWYMRLAMTSVSKLPFVIVYTTSKVFSA